MCDQACGTCRFFEADYLMNRGRDKDDEKDGFCRRFPPSLALTDTCAEDWDERRREILDDGGLWTPRAIHDQAHWTQPVTIESNWCGEYQERQEDTP